MDFKSKIILISGPTASGKSHFAIKLAKKIQGEIINADSMQVYKQLKILSARPNPKNYQKIKHHLYGFHDVKKNFSTGDWLKLSIKKIKDINLNAVPPVPMMLVGLQGSGKTTTTAKLARYLENTKKKKVMMVSLDIYRPAAQEQLRLLGEQKGKFTSFKIFI